MLNKLFGMFSSSGKEKKEALVVQNNQKNFRKSVFIKGNDVADLLKTDEDKEIGIKRTFSHRRTENPDKLIEPNQDEQNKEENKDINIKLFPTVIVQDKPEL